LKSPSDLSTPGKENPLRGFPLHKKFCARLKISRFSGGALTDGIVWAASVRSLAAQTRSRRNTPPGSIGKCDGVGNRGILEGMPPDAGAGLMEGRILFSSLNDSLGPDFRRRRTRKNGRNRGHFSPCGVPRALRLLGGIPKGSALCVFPGAPAGPASTRPAARRIPSSGRNLQVLRAVALAGLQPMQSEARPLPLASSHS
jgi:hypothetical protein